MNQIEQNPTLYQKIVDNHVDYSEIYRTQETIQLNKRLRKTRNILLICAMAFVAGAGVFWMMPETSFTAKNFSTRHWRTVSTRILRRSSIRRCRSRRTAGIRTG